MKKFSGMPARILLVGLLLSFGLLANAQNASDGEAMAKIKKGNKCGFINSKGEIAVKPQYDDALDFSNGLAAVKVGELWGAIDKTNTLVIRPQFAEGFTFKKDRAAVSRPGKTGFDVIDKTGKVTFHTEYYFVFFNGFADGVEPVTNQKTQKVGLISKMGKMVKEPVFDEVRPFSEGMAVFKRVTQYGYINKTGDIVIQPTFIDASSFNNGIAVVKSGLRSGIINKAGKFIVPIGAYPNIFEFSDGMLKVAKKNKDMQSKMGYVDRTGKLVIPPQYDEAGDFHEGKACVLQDGKYGYIDTTGKLVIPCQFENLGEFSEGLASISKDGKFGFIDANGKIVIQPQFNSVTPFEDGFSIVEKDGSYGVVDKTGRLTVNAKYSEISPMAGDLYKIGNGSGGFGLIDHNDRTLLPVQYEEIGGFSR